MNSSSSQPSDDVSNPLPGANGTLPADTGTGNDRGAERAPHHEAAVASAPASAWPAVPGYEIVKVLGRGGMGIVYKARQVGLERYVALKMILSGMHASPAETARFFAEGEAVARLQHTNIVQIYQVGRHGDLPFFSMEYVNGGSLAHHLDGTPLASPDAARLVEALARGIHLAHQKGIIHRDLKPANVLLASGGRRASSPPDAPSLVRESIPKITDFGLAKRVESASGLTQTGVVVGTPSYMAPEQAEGKKEVGPPADIYSLGAILYELLTGRPPFRGPTPMDTVLQVLSSDPVPPSRLQPGCPRDLETICLKCLHKEPQRRYPSAEALADDLQRYLTDRPILARRAGAGERLRRWCRRNPVVAGLTSALALLLVLLAIGSSAAALVFVHQRNEAERNLARALRAEDEQDEHLWNALVARARAGRFSRRAGQRFDSLAAIAQAVRIARARQIPAERFEQLRHEAIACLALPDVRLREWDGWPEGSVGVDVTGARGLYARTDRQGNVSVRRLEDDEETARLAGDGVKVRPYFSPDGQILLLCQLGGSHAVRLWRPGENKPFVEVPGRPDVVDVQISPDASRFALGFADGTVDLHELPSGRQTVLTGEGNNLFQLRFSPGGRWLAVSRSGALTLHDLRAGTARVLGRGAHPDLLWFGPDDRQLAVLTSEFGHPEARVARVFDLESGKLAARLEHPDGVCTLSWHPNGKSLATGTFHTSIITFWDVPSRTQTRTLVGHRGGGLFVYFNRTGDLLLSFSKWAGGARLWHARSGKLLLVSPEKYFEHLPQAAQGGSLIRAEADGRLLALVSAGGRLRLWEACPSREHRILVRESAPAPATNQPFHLRQLLGPKEDPPRELPGALKTTFRAVSVHPGGRLLAAAMDEGLGLWDLDSGGSYGLLSTAATTGTAFDGTGALWTRCSRGLQRWPVRAESGAAGRLRVGPPQTFLAGSCDGRVSASRDGRTAAGAADGARGAVVVHRDRADSLVWLAPQHDVRGVSISPDGELVAAGSHFEDPRTPGLSVKVWQARTGRLVKTLPISSGAYPCFSPDGRWLLVPALDRPLRLWSVPDWREHPSLEGIAAAFTPDSKHLAVETGGVLRLLTVPDGQPVVRLEDPGQARAVALTFTPDGTRLLFASNDDQALHVWDLRALREGLAEMDLDWDQEPYPPGHAFPSSGGTLLLTVDRSSP